MIGIDDEALFDPTGEGDDHALHDRTGLRSPIWRKAVLRGREPGPRFGGPALTSEEAQVFEAALPLRLGGSVVRWVGSRWVDDDTDVVPRHEIPDADRTWFGVRPLAPWGRACKVFSGVELVRGYALGMWIGADVFEAKPGVRGLADLWGRIVRDRRVCLVRGIPARAPVQIPEDEARGLDRGVGVRKASAAVSGAFLAPHPIGRRAIILDLDERPAPAWAPQGRAPTPDEARALVRYVADHYLPRAWQGATVAYRWTSKAGLRGWSTLSMHLGLWLDRPIYDEPLRRWVATWSEVDTSICGSVQAIYTAAPVFVDGGDPLEAAGISRVGLVEGERDEVAVPASAWSDSHGVVPLVDGPAWHAHEHEEAARQASARAVAEAIGAARAVREPAADVERRLRGYASAALRRGCEALRGAAQGVAGGRHDTLLREARSVGSFALAGLLTRDEVASQLLETFVAVAGASRRSEGARTIEDGLDDAPAVSRDALLARLGSSSQARLA